MRQSSILTAAAPATQRLRRPGLPARGPRHLPRSLTPPILVSSAPCRASPRSRSSERAAPATPGAAPVTPAARRSDAPALLPCRLRANPA
eukprot:14721679-Alexandrium_andersonii.AAC.1